MVSLIWAVHILLLSLDIPILIYASSILGLSVGRTEEGEQFVNKRCLSLPPWEKFLFHTCNQKSSVTVDIIFLSGNPKFFSERKNEKLQKPLVFRIYACLSKCKRHCHCIPLEDGNQLRKRIIPSILLVIIAHSRIGISNPKNTPRASVALIHWEKPQLIPFVLVLFVCKNCCCCCILSFNPDFWLAMQSVSPLST